MTSLTSRTKTIAEWFTTEKLEIYFEVVKNVLVDAKVADRNSDFDQTAPYFEELLITRQKWIYSYDETKMELDCTKGGAGKLDRAIRSSTP